MPKKKKKIDMQKILTGGKTHTVTEPYPNGTQAFVPVEQIKDGIVCTQIHQDFRGSSGQLSSEKSAGTGNDHLLFCRISQNSTGSSANSGTHAARRYRRLLCQHGSLLQSRGKPKLQRDDTGNCTDGQPVCGE